MDRGYLKGTQQKAMAVKFQRDMIGAFTQMEGDGQGLSNDVHSMPFKLLFHL